MTSNELLALFLEKIPSEYPKHLLGFFAANAMRGRILPFASSFLRAIGTVEAVVPGYAKEMMDRIAAIRGKGEAQYEALLEILAEIYVTSGVAEKADRKEGVPLFTHEPGPTGKKKPEFEVSIGEQWCAIEVKTPRLIQYGRSRGTNPWQLGVRLPRDITKDMKATRPRDNPVKDFLIYAEEKFADYETHRNGALRILIIVWDDYCNEPIAALTSPVSGLLTPNSFHRNNDGTPVTFPHVDGIIVIRHQHQLKRATRCDPLIDGIGEPFAYHHYGFPPKAFIQVPGGRSVPNSILEALNALPLSACFGAEYQPAELITWVGGASGDVAQGMQSPEG